MAEIKLKPCPFCGGIAEVVRTEKWEKVIFFATCLYCGAEMPRNSRTVAEASEAWNRRVTMATKEEVEAKYCDVCKNKNHCRIPCAVVTAALWDLPCEKRLLQMCEEKSRRGDNG